MEDWFIHGLIVPSSLKKIKEKINKKIETLEKANLKRLSTRGDSVQYNLKDHINNDLLKTLKEIVLNRYSKLFETDDVDLKLTNAWTVKAEKTGWHKIHQHNKNVFNENSISVVIYLETPKPEERLVDYPGHFYYLFQKNNDSYIRCEEIPVEEGLILLMPHWIWHGAYPASGKRQTLNLEFEY